MEEAPQPAVFCKALVKSNLAEMASSWMVIPAAFIKSHSKDIGQVANLQGPSGQVWQVVIGRTADCVAFKEGWRGFAADNNLEMEDTLVFTLTGRSQFSVQVFDMKTGVQKVSSLTAKNTRTFCCQAPPMPQGGNSEFAVKVVDTKTTVPKESALTGVSDCKASPMLQGGKRKAESTSSVEGPMTQLSLKKRLVVEAQLKKPVEVGVHQYIATAREVAMDSNMDERKQRTETGISNSIIEQASHVVNQSKRPCHLVALQTFHVTRKFLRFKIKFGKRFMPPKTTQMELIDPAGRRWPMVWHRENETHMGLRKGWVQFCRAHKLREGDICVFELMETTNLTLLAHIFHRGDGSKRVPDN